MWRRNYPTEQTPAGPNGKIRRHQPIRVRVGCSLRSWCGVLDIVSFGHNRNELAVGSPHGRPPWLYRQTQGCPVPPPMINPGPYPKPHTTKVMMMDLLSLLVAYFVVIADIFLPVAVLHFQGTLVPSSRLSLLLSPAPTQLHLRRYLRESSFSSSRRTKLRFEALAALWCCSSRHLLSRALHPVLEHAGSPLSLPCCLHSGTPRTLHLRGAPAPHHSRHGINLEVKLWITVHDLTQ